MRKKVLFVITKSDWGGAQRYVYDLATHLPQETFEPVVALGGNGELKTRLEEAGIRAISIPTLERNVHIIKELQSLKHLWHLFHQEHPDIIHLNSSKVGGLGSAVAFIYKIAVRWKFYYKKLLEPRHAASNPDASIGTPTSDKIRASGLQTIFTVHGWAFNEERNRVARSMIRLLQLVTVWFCHHIIIIANRDFRQALHLPLVKRKKFVFIPLGIPQESISFLSKQAAKKNLSTALKIPAKHLSIVIGTIAELTKNKGLEYLIEAIVRLVATSGKTPGVTTSDVGSPGVKELAVIIIGEGEERKKLETLIQQYNLQNTVLFAGFVPNAAQYLKAFDVFVLSSLKEGLPYTILEAMHAGVPVVGTRVGGIPDLIEQEGTGIIVPSKNAEELSGAVRRLLDDTTLRRKFGKQAQKRAKEKFSFETMLAATIRLYNSI